MCMTAVAQVRSVDDASGLALVLSDDGVSTVSLAPIVLDGGRITPGDWVLVHTGFAVEVLCDADAQDLRDAIAALTTPGGPR